MAISTCTICDTPLRPFAPAGPPVCDSLTCRWQYRALAPAQLCRICGRRLVAADLPAEACRDRDCWTTLGKLRARSRTEELEAKLAAFREKVERRRPALRNRSLTVIQVPGYKSPTVTVPRRRKERFQRQLAWIWRGEQPPFDQTRPPAEPPEGALDAALGRACAACRGRCCENGNDHAYLNQAKLQQVAAERGLSGDAVIALYLSFLPTRHHVDSCIYHTATGCTLARELRSDTCNNYFCRPLAEFMAHAAEHPETPVLLASVRRYEIRGGVVVDGNVTDAVRP